jgi:hypothetical protein
MKIRSKSISKTHISEYRFNPYSRARKYVQHLNSLYELKKEKDFYDQSNVLNQIFKQQTPLNCINKLSLLPKSSMSNDTKDRIKLVNEFHNFSDKKIKKNVKNSKSVSPVCRKIQNELFQPKKYLEIMNKLCNKNTDISFSKIAKPNSFLLTSSNTKLKKKSIQLSNRENDFNEPRLKPFLISERNSDEILESNNKFPVINKVNRYPIKELNDKQQ